MKPGADFKPITGKNVVLKARDASFLRDYYARRLRPDVLEWADVWPKNPSYEEVRLSFATQEESPKDWRLWIHSFAGRLVGEASLMDIDRSNRRAEFGICIFDPDYWQKGFGTEAGRLFLADAVKRFGLELVYELGCCSGKVDFHPRSLADPAFFKYLLNVADTVRHLFPEFLQAVVVKAGDEDIDLPVRG